MRCCGVNGSQCFGEMSGTTHQCHSITSYKNEASYTNMATNKKISTSITNSTIAIQPKLELQLQINHSCGGVRVDYLPMWLRELYNSTPPMNPLNLHRYNITFKPLAILLVFSIF